MIRGMKKSFFVSLILLVTTMLSACSHPSAPQFEDHLADLRCDQAAAALPGSDPLAQTAKTMSYLSRQVAAYTYITAGYATEVVWDVTTGTIMVVVLCSPTLAVAVASSRSGNRTPVGPICFPLNRKTTGRFFSPPLGRQAQRQTQDFRCPDLKSVSDPIQKVARCYEKRGDQASLQKAAQSLENIERSQDFFTCLPPAEQMEITSYREELQRALKKTP